MKGHNHLPPDMNEAVIVFFVFLLAILLMAVFVFFI